MTVDSVVWAGMDVGTNSVKVLVGRVFIGEPSRRVEVLLHDVLVTRMGEGLNATGRLGDAPMARAISAIRQLAEEARRFGPAGISTLGMEAFRRAANGSEFAHHIEQVTGIPLRILTGVEEASLGREGVLAGFGEPLPEQVLIMDVGGGSSELALTEPRWEVSIPRGAVTTTEAYLRGDPPDPDEMGAMRAGAREAVTSAWHHSPVRGVHPPVIAVGGTVTAYATMHLKMARWEPERIHGLGLSLEEIEHLTDELASMPLAVRREVVGLDPARAPVILGGGALLEAVLHAVGVPELRLSLANLLHAHLIREADRWHAEHTPQDA